MREVMRAIEGIKATTDAYNGQFARIDERFARIDERFVRIDERFDTLIEMISDFATDVDRRFAEVDARFVRNESVMVTKDYLDDKLADLRGDLNGFLRRHFPTADPFSTL